MFPAGESSNKNIPNRCLTPVYSQDSIPEHHVISQDYQEEIQSTFKPEDTNDGETCVRGNELCKEETPLEMDIDPGETSTTPKDCKSEEDTQMKIKEEMPQEIVTYLGDTQRDIKVEEKEEGHARIKEEILQKSAQEVWCKRQKAGPSEGEETDLQGWISDHRH